MPAKGEKRVLDRASVWSLPAGPEITGDKKKLFKGTRQEALEYYNLLRENGTEKHSALLVQDCHGDVIYACS